jgi:uncharacterized protein involved in response to NO
MWLGEWILLVEILLILILLFIFYQFKVRGRAEQALKLILVLIILISYFELRACTWRSDFTTRCMVRTVLIFAMLFIVDVGAVTFFLIHRIEKKWAEPRIKRRAEEQIKKREAKKKTKLKR